MPRLCETCTAATNWPRWSNPLAASCRFVPFGRSPCRFEDSLVFWLSKSLVVFLPVLLVLSLDTSPLERCSVGDSISLPECPLPTSPGVLGLPPIPPPTPPLKPRPC